LIHLLLVTLLTTGPTLCRCNQRLAHDDLSYLLRHSNYNEQFSKAKAATRTKTVLKFNLSFSCGFVVQNAEGRFMNSYLLELRIRRALGRFRPLDAPVLVLEELKVAYVPVPKAANSSVRSALMASIGNEVAELLSVQELHNSTQSMLQPTSAFFSRRRADWYVFTVVRNPSTRARSAWQNKLIDPPEVFGPLKRMGIRERLSFDDFLQTCANWPSWALNDHFMPQSLYLSKVLDLPDLDILHVETLSQDWPMLRDKLIARGASSPPSALGHKNASTIDETPETSVGARKTLNAIYGKDYDRFGYERP
jgi:hypothetical protein